MIQQIFPGNHTYLSYKKDDKTLSEIDGFDASKFFEYLPYLYCYFRKRDDIYCVFDSATGLTTSSSSWNDTVGIKDELENRLKNTFLPINTWYKDKDLERFFDMFNSGIGLQHNRYSHNLKNWDESQLKYDVVSALVEMHPILHEHILNAYQDYIPDTIKIDGLRSLLKKDSDTSKNLENIIIGLSKYYDTKYSGTESSDMEPPRYKIVNDCDPKTDYIILSGKSDSEKCLTEDFDLEKIQNFAADGEIIIGVLDIPNDTTNKHLYYMRDRLSKLEKSKLEIAVSEGIAERASVSGDGNCFFHAALGKKIQVDGNIIADKIVNIRTETHKELVKLIELSDIVEDSALIGKYDEVKDKLETEINKLMNNKIIESNIFKGLSKIEITLDGKYRRSSVKCNDVSPKTKVWIRRMIDFDKKEEEKNIITKYDAFQCQFALGLQEIGETGEWIDIEKNAYLILFAWGLSCWFFTNDIHNMRPAPDRTHVNVLRALDYDWQDIAYDIANLDDSIDIFYNGTNHFDRFLVHDFYKFWHPTPANYIRYLFRKWYRQIRKKIADEVGPKQNIVIQPLGNLNNDILRQEFEKFLKDLAINRPDIAARTSIFVNDATDLKEVNPLLLDNSHKGGTRIKRIPAKEKKKYKRVLVCRRPKKPIFEWNPNWPS